MKIIGKGVEGKLIQKFNPIFKDLHGRARTEGYVVVWDTVATDVYYRYLECVN